MFRRSSKLTAMLVAAAAVVSIVPATAAERLGTKDGNITNAVAFNGGYVYDGYRTDDDDTSVYYNNGTKDVEIDADEDYDSYDLSRYGTKYATVKDGQDEYLVDLSTGKIDDEETLADKLENAKNKLKSKLNKTDRYENFKDFEDDDKDVSRILQNKYGEVWYQYAADGDSDVEKRMTTSAAVEGYVGFTDESGKYIDASQTANMYIYVPAEEKTVKFEEYGDVEEYGDNENKTELTVRLNKVTPVSQDKDYIYAVAEVEVGTSDEDNNITAVPGVQSTQYFFQKISKEQGDKQDGAYLPKSVSSYQLDTSKIYDNGDMSDATNVLLAAVGYIKDGKDTKVLDGDGRKVVNVEVKDGMIYATSVANDKVKVWKLKFKKDKVDAFKIDEDGNYLTKDDKKVKVEKRDAYVVKKDGDGDHDIVNSAVSIDADGNTWALDKGVILKADGTDFKEIYTVDRSLNHLDVYDEKNLISWADEDVYTTVSEGKKQTEADAGVDEDKKDETPVVKAGWDKNADGTWAFYKDGAKATGWLNDKGTWYYLDAAGTMKTGWVNDNGTWYYCNASGAMQTGWVNDNGTWYYCNASGAMQTGWLLDGTTWYYLNANGSMAANTTVDGYVLGANGAWVK
ncbi:N-acetylmuramoyl-L-alanine amidase family protein [Clostridium butyricum]|uniref:N-acetylmuramoyl-L-alanine amidase family protein n=1 Tax=Clostridium butyricum TaxID=1492 RepID=UPI000F546A2D|nr:N-acetylmuramoyl-L-alanine amidase family protein [Clostridium butyricum]RQN10601.1 N-acetylmuramoyl-L-alanine amidase family protein [Clostridium butyricum]